MHRRLSSYLHETGGWEGKWCLMPSSSQPDHSLCAFCLLSGYCKADSLDLILPCHIPHKQRMKTTSQEGEGAWESPTIRIQYSQTAHGVPSSGMAPGSSGIGRKVVAIETWADPQSEPWKGYITWPGKQSQSKARSRTPSCFM